MKSNLSTLILVAIATFSFAQSPNKMSYQSVIRDASSKIVASSPVAIKLSILQSSTTGTVVYSETHSSSTNANGLVSLEIGNGTVISGSFSSINWANGPFFLKSETDPNGGTSYTISGTIQLISVPYALHATTADSLIGRSAGNSRYIGELFGGGIIFELFDNGKHGLIASLHDLDSAGAPWGPTSDVTNCESMTNGATNTSSMVSAGAVTSSAAGLCNSYRGGGFSDWYLPSVRELHQLIDEDLIVNRVLENDGDPKTKGLTHSYSSPTSGSYWTSTESFKTSEAFYYNFFEGQNRSGGKSFKLSVRAIRAF